MWDSFDIQMVNGISKEPRHAISSRRRYARLVDICRDPNYDKTRRPDATNFLQISPDAEYLYPRFLFPKIVKPSPSGPFTKVRKAEEPYYIATSDCMRPACCGSFSGTAGQKLWRCTSTGTDLKPVKSSLHLISAALLRSDNSHSWACDTQHVHYASMHSRYRRQRQTRVPLTVLTLSHWLLPRDAGALEYAIDVISSILMEAAECSGSRNTYFAAGRRPQTVGLQQKILKATWELVAHQIRSSAHVKRKLKQRKIR